MPDRRPSPLPLWGINANNLRWTHHKWQAERAQPFPGLRVTPHILSENLFLEVLLYESRDCNGLYSPVGGCLRHPPI